MRWYAYLGLEKAVAERGDYATESAPGRPGGGLVRGEVEDVGIP